MAHVVVLGAGLGGSIMAYELRDQLRKEDTITVVTKDPTYHFVPSNLDRRGLARPRRCDG